VVLQKGSSARAGTVGERDGGKYEEEYQSEN
jgi:hypothetical protein